MVSAFACSVGEGPRALGNAVATGWSGSADRQSAANQVDLRIPARLAARLLKITGPRGPRQWFRGGAASRPLTAATMILCRNPARIRRFVLNARLYSVIWPLTIRCRLGG